VPIRFGGNLTVSRLSRGDEGGEGGWWWHTSYLVLSISITNLSLPEKRSLRHQTWTECHRDTGTWCSLAAEPL
jgi:hypothetical protein